MHQHAAVVRLLNEIRKHLFGDFEVGDDAVFHRLDGHHVAGSAAQHFLGFAADGDHLAGGFIDGHDRRFVHDDAFAVREHQSVGRPEVNGEVGRKQTKHRPHVVTVLIHPYFPPRRKTPRRPAGKALRAARSALLLLSPGTPTCANRYGLSFENFTWARRWKLAHARSRHGGSAQPPRYYAVPAQAAQ